jgi:hypothetical protein
LAIDFTKVVSGTANFLHTETTHTVTLTGGDIVGSRDYTVLFFSYEQTGTSGTANPKNAVLRGRLTATNTIVFDRNNAQGARTVEWFLVEFNSDVKVQHFAGTTSSTPVSCDVTSSSLVIAESFPVVGVGGLGNAMDGSDCNRAHYTSTTNLSVYWEDTTWLSSTPYAAQSVYLPGSTVTSGSTTSLTTGSVTVSSLASATASETFLLFSWGMATSSSTNADKWAIRGDLASATSITFDRSATSGQDMDITYHRVEVPTSILQQVEKVDVTQTTSQTSVSHNLSTSLTDETNAAIICGDGGYRALGTIADTDDDFESCSLGLKINSGGTSIQSDRQISNSLATSAYAYVVEFKSAGGAATTPKGVFGLPIHGPMIRAVYT